jgi:regulator of protease activity HflC (stomatin/prohibitin superfamily)
MEKSKAIFFIILIIGCLILFNSFFLVGAGQVGVKYNIINGDTSSNSQGLHFKLPFFERVAKFDVRTSRIDVKAIAASKDLQTVKVDTVINLHLDYKEVDTIFIKVGRDYKDKIIMPTVNEVVKSVVAKYPVEQIIIERQQVKDQIEESLKQKLVQYNIILENVNIVDIDFSDEFNKVVEQKQIEEQKIKTAEYQRLQAEQFKQKRILEAEAEAEAQKLLQKSATKEVIDLKWIEKWNGNLPETMLAGNSSFIVDLKRDK